MAYTGSDRESDRMDREAENERSYNNFQDNYIYKHLRPNEIDVLLWDAMWDKLPYRDTRKEAVQDAKNLAKALSINTKIVGDRYFRAIPADWYENIKYGFNRYGFMRSDYIKQLVIVNTYPDLVKIARESNNSEQHGIFRHYIDVVSSRHKGWIAKNESK